MDSNQQRRRKPVRHRKWAFPIIPICIGAIAFTVLLVPLIIMLTIGGNAISAPQRFVIASCVGTNCSTALSNLTYCNDTLAILVNCNNTGTLNQTSGMCAPIVIPCDNSTFQTVLYCNNTVDVFLCDNTTWVPFAMQEMDSPKLLTFTPFGSSISGSTAHDPPGTLQYVYIDRNGTIIPSDQTPVPVPFSALLTFVTFNGTIPQNQDIVRHVYYTNPGLVLITQVEFQYQEQCFTLIGFDTLVCWTGTDYCFYPLQLGGLNGVVVNSLSEVATYVNGVGGGPFAVDPTTGCWNRLEPFIAKKKRNAPLPTPIRTGRPDKYMIIQVTTGAANLPFVSTRNVDIDWGDGTIETTTSHTNHTYISNVTKIIRLAGTARTLSFSTQPIQFRGMVIGVSQWGDVVTNTLNFQNEAFDVVATDAPNPSLVDISNLFAFTSTGTINTDAWSLPNVVSASNAFKGNIVSKAVFSSVLTTAGAMYMNAQMPGFDTTGSGFTLSASATDMFRNAIITGPVIFNGVTVANPIRMFQGATFQSSVSFTMCAMSGTATSAFEQAIFTSTSNFNGLDMSTVIVSDAVFAFANFVNNVPAMANLNLNASTNVNDLFRGVNRVPNLPNLGLSQATVCRESFWDHAVIVEPFIPTWPAMKCTNANRMFASTYFSQGADFSQMYVGNVVLADIMFGQPSGDGNNRVTRVTGNFTSPGNFASCTSATEIFQSMYCTSIGACPFPFNFRSISFPVALDLTRAFSNIGFTVQGATTISNMPNLDLSMATSCAFMIFAADNAHKIVVSERFVPNWPNMKCSNALSMMQNVIFSLGADFSNISVAQISTGQNAFRETVYNGLTASIMPGAFSAMTFAPNIFSQAFFQTTPDWSSLSIPLVSNAFAAFFSVNRLGPMPALNPVSVVTGSSMFALSTIVAPLQSHLWTFPALTDASSMFLGTNFGNFAFRTDTWGMGAIQILDSTFNTATNVPSTINVANWQVNNLVTFSGFVFGVNNTALVIDLSTWNTPALMNMPSAFSNTLNVQFVGIGHLNTANVIDITNAFFDANVNNNNITNWITTNVILASGAFERLVPHTLDVSGFNMPSLTFASTMFRNSNMNPNITNWNLASVTSAFNITHHCYITKANYDQVLIGFASRSTLNNETLGRPQSNPLISSGDTADAPQFFSAAAQTARNNLTARGWIISDGGLQ